MKTTLIDVTKKFGRLKALDSVSIEVEPGQILAVLGPNGAGKTTLLRAMSGVVAPTKGHIHYDDERFLRGRIDLRKRIMFLPDTPAAYASMTALQHFGMVLQLYDRNAEEVDEAIVKLLRDLDILPYAKVPLSTLSRGQLYKAMITALVAVDPDIWLIDEPFASGMDPNGIMAFKRYCREAAERGRTIVYTTQIIEAAESLCDRVCIIHKGSVQLSGTIDELRERAGRDNDVLSELFRQLREETQ